MKRTSYYLIILALLMLAGCRSGESSTTSTNEVVYMSETSPEDCYICGNGADSLVTVGWGQENIALVSLNTFEIKPLEINRYDRLDGHLIEETSGTVSFGGGGSQDGGFSATLLLDCDRGYATGTIDFYNDETLDIEKAASFLCSDCLNEIIPKDLSRCFGVGAINLKTKELRIFEENITGFGIGDFYFDCGLREENSKSHQMHLLVFYCPLRYD